MPNFNSAQLAAFLNLLSEPARLYNVRGDLVAENSAAQSINWPDENGKSKGIVHTVDLGEGWFIHRMDGVASDTTMASLKAHRDLRPNLQALTSGITHELRNPLAAILTAAGLLQDDASLTEETGMLLDVIRKESRRMNQILTEFSLYVKLPQPHPQEFDLAQIAREAVEELKRDGTLHEGIEVQNKLTQPLTVCADADQIQQVLTRLLKNAGYAVAEQENGTITLHGYAHGDNEKIVFCVEDNGPGLSEEDLQRAFLPFYSSKPQSVGLGLSIAQVAVQASGGHIWIENKKPQAELPQTATQTSAGARVCFALPKQSANA